MNPNAPMQTAVGGTIGCLIGVLPALVASLVSDTAAGVALGLNMTEEKVRNVPVDQTSSIIHGTASTITDNLNLGHLLSIDMKGPLDCIARAIARALLQQIMISTINWINSGFSGSPSFVPNYQNFFQSLADNAVGALIQSSQLSFLCSPFQLQIRIAIAQSYAGRSSTPSCTLGAVTKNIQGFLNRFDQGGWSAFVSFTRPTNNPFGEFMHVEGMLQARIADRAKSKSMDLGLGAGFLSTTEEQNCRTYSSGNASDMQALGKMDMTNKSQTVLSNDNSGNVTQRICDQVNVTPGTAIGDSLNQALGAGKDQLVNAKYFDEIISALVTQLVTNVLQSGMSNVSGGGGYGNNSFGSPDYSQLRQNILGSIDSATQVAQATQSTEQQKIDAASSTIANFNTSQACWSAIVTACNAGPAVSFSTTTNTTITTQYAAKDCQTAMDSASSTATASVRQAVGVFQDNMNRAQGQLSALQSLADQVNSTPDTDPQTLMNLNLQFQNGIANGDYPNMNDSGALMEDTVNSLSSFSSINNIITASTTACQAIRPQVTTSTPNLPTSPRAN